MKDGFEYKQRKIDTLKILFAVANTTNTLLCERKDVFGNTIFQRKQNKCASDEQNIMSIKLKYERCIRR